MGRDLFFLRSTSPTSRQTSTSSGLCRRRAFPRFVGVPTVGVYPDLVGVGKPGIFSCYSLAHAVEPEEYPPRSEELHRLWNLFRHNLYTLPLPVIPNACEESLFASCVLCSGGLLRPASLPIPLLVTSHWVTWFLSQRVTPSCFTLHEKFGKEHDLLPLAGGPDDESSDELGLLTLFFFFVTRVLSTRAGVAPSPPESRYARPY
jgi:hypothetical protein